MIARVLPREEYGRLEKLGVTEWQECASPEIVVVEEDGKIIARMSVLRLTHLEGLWIAPEHRSKGGTLRALLRKTCETAKQWPETWAIAGCDSEQMSGYLGRLGLKINTEYFALPMGKG